MTMKVWINHNTKEISVKTAKNIRQKLEAAGFEFDKKNPDLAISVGGDGTFLSTFHEYTNRLSQMKFIGIHTGHLGFYADWRDNEVDELIEALKNYDGQTFEYPVLEADITYTDNTTKSFYALNEAIIKRPSKTMRADVYLDGEFFERFRGDGLSFSTPSGSTAYAKSIGGAVIHPKSRVMQVNEIAPINNRIYRSISAPIIVPSSQEVKIIPAEGSDYIVNYDTNSRTNCSVKLIKYRISKEVIQFAKLRDRHFWGRVEHAFLGTNDYK
ncbi:NAD kinase [Companilactobacillus sp. RD055328]|uniref:NAD kinase n=1 Tax=Companilactobacillus sp. RD055328 TaxID=2916634 RepID=UPI001FC7FEC5|nr:NAD kinase [Companilactobacillus sp. RD055328]GKQ43083.1 NAD kinase [Companilactobacillus sp. RD055328]